MRTKKNYFAFVISILFCLIFAFNAIAIKPFTTKLAMADSNTTTEQTTSEPETEYKVNYFDSSLIEEQEKHESVEEIAEEKLLNTNDGDENQTINENFKIISMVCANIEYYLEYVDFDVFEAQAYDIDKDCWYSGYVYTDYSLYLEDYVIAGFVTIDNDADITENSNLIAFNNDENDNNKYLITANDLELLKDHFIIDNKYVKYEWKNCFLVNYIIAENNYDDYDLSYGKLFSYDDSKYVYDNDFTYTSQEVCMMFNEIDFDKLQQTLNEINEEQNKNGYYVQEVTITYIDMELIEEWERCSDKTSFYGYDLEELNASFGDATLEFTSDGVKQAALIEDPKPTNWLKAGLMFLGGCAAILIGAALAPLTGGCSFGASLLCIVKMTAIAMATDLLVKVAVSTISGVVKGQNFWDSLSGSIKSTLTVENIAQSFMTSAIMSAIMVGSGLVKACFVEGTPVLTENGYTNIENLSVGDKVLSYSELTGMVALKQVTDTMVSQSNDICTIALDSGETITSTSLHPWYVQNKGWTPAYALTSQDNLLTETGKEVRILGVNRQILDEAINVYNITVDETTSEDYHTYFVGTDNILVHNACSTKATKNDVQKQVEKHHFLTNKNKKWTPEFKKVTDKYNLDLNGKWNIQEMAHRGRHATEYHKAMLEQVQQIDKIANGNKDIFLKLFDGLKQKIIDTPESLYKAFWRNGGKLF